MLPRSKRLTKEDFEGVRLKIFYRSELFDVAYMVLPRNTATPGKKFACVISKKTLKKAVDRNKAKRRVFEALHVLVKERIVQDHFYVIYPKKNILTTPYAYVHEEIYKAFATLQ